MKTKISSYAFSSIYPMYLKKAEKKGRTKDEVDAVIMWLTGYDEAGLNEQIDAGNDLEIFFENAPSLNPNASKITGKICGVKVEEIADPLTQKIRWLDKLIDELAKGKALEVLIP